VGIFQDRLVSELRLAKAKTAEQGQAVLDRICLSITASIFPFHQQALDVRFS